MCTIILIIDIFHNDNVLVVLNENDNSIILTFMWILNRLYTRPHMSGIRAVTDFVDGEDWFLYDLWYDVYLDEFYDHLNEFFDNIINELDARFPEIENQEIHEVMIEFQNIPYDSNNLLNTDNNPDIYWDNWNNDFEDYISDEDFNYSYLENNTDRFLDDSVWHYPSP